ncbi:hypothetical protein [Bartonella sp. CB189]|uniref:hypothetical protein n=1 Tax=Bartonella sp. CB189 TaxID=3112254 RepID=UPI002F962AD0
MEQEYLTNIEKNNNATEIHNNHTQEQKDNIKNEQNKIIQKNTTQHPQKNFMEYTKSLAEEGQKQEDVKKENNSNEEQKLYSFYQSAVSDIKQKYNDFDQAADFIYDMRAKQLAAFSSIYPEMENPKVVDTIIGNELNQMLKQCEQKNQNPAEIIYNIAQNIGYQKQKNDNNKNINKKYDAARTLAAYNGLAPSEAISLDMINKMSEQEFCNWVSDHKNKNAFNNLMRGEKR